MVSPPHNSPQHAYTLWCPPHNSDFMCCKIRASDTLWCPPHNSYIMRTRYGAPPREPANFGESVQRIPYELNPQGRGSCTLLYYYLLLI